MVTLAIVLSIPIPIKTQINRICYGLPATDWIEKESLELTLLSSKEVDGNTVLDVEEEMAKLEIEPFEITFQGINFTSLNKSKGIITLSVKESQSLTTLNKTIHESLKETLKGNINKQKEPLVLLGFIRDLNPIKLGEYLDMYHSFSTDSFTPQTIKLMKNSQNATPFTEQARFSIPTKKEPPKKYFKILT